MAIDRLRENYTVICNLDNSSMLLLERRLQTLIVPHINLVQQNTTLGTCSDFHVDKIDPV